MKPPTYNVTYFDGVIMKIQMKFFDPTLLSKSTLKDIDKITFTFNKSQIFVAKGGFISQD